MRGPLSKNEVALIEARCLQGFYFVLVTMLRITKVDDVRIETCQTNGIEVLSRRAHDVLPLQQMPSR